MDYAECRERIATGDVLLFRGRRLWSWAIQWRTKSVYSHVGVAVWIEIVETGTRRLVILEAKEGRGVQLWPLSQYLAEGQRIDWFQITDSAIDKPRAAAWALKQYGQRYASLWQLLRSFGLVGIVKLIADHFGLPTKVDRDRWFCSCYVAHYLLAGGWRPEGSDQSDPSLMSPGEVALLPCLQRRGTLQFSNQGDR